MAMTAAAAGGGAAGAARRGHGAINEINMTPFIDVMLVLLIIFMVAAPLMTAGVPLDLPQTKAAPLNIRREAGDALDQGERPGLPGRGRADRTTTIVGKLTDAPKHGFDERIFVRGDKKVDYGRVAQVMSIVTAAGFKQVALVTEPDQR